MTTRLNKKYLEAAFWRAFRTFFQVVASMIVVGATIREIDWVAIASTAVVAAVASLAMSLGKEIPEMSTDGVMTIDDTDTVKDIYKLDLGDELETLSKKDIVAFKVVHK